MLLADIVYTGTVYDNGENPRPLFQAVKELYKEMGLEYGNITIDFYGGRKGWIDDLAKEYGLGNVVIQHGEVTHKETLEIQREARILWIMGWDGNKGVIPGKLFEYITAGRPILATCTERGEISRILNETRTGLWCPEVEDIKMFIGDII